MDGFTDADRTRAIEMAQYLATMTTRLARIEYRQSVVARRVRRLPKLVANEVVRGISKRTMILIGMGIAIGSALGGVGIELVRAGAAQLIRGMGGH